MTKEEYDRYCFNEESNGEIPLLYPTLSTVTATVFALPLV